MQNPWPLLQPCTHQLTETSGGVKNHHKSQLMDENLQFCESHSNSTCVGNLNDRLSPLPDDILLSILSSFSMKEVARASVLSHRWNYMWQNFPILNFEDRKAEYKIFDRSRDLDEERSQFVSWVNRVLDQHLAPAVDELRITFYLDPSCQNHIDKWVHFALTKQVKTFKLDLTPPLGCGGQHPNCTIPLEYTPCNLVGVQYSFTSLCLKRVNISTEQVRCLLMSCPFLENLRIVGSAIITSVSVCGASLQLKHLRVSRCPNMKTIDISAPKLESFRYIGHPLKLHIGDASSLTKVSIGGLPGDPIDFVFESLARYFPQFECLTLRMYLHRGMNLHIDRPPSLKNLKCLELRVYGRCNQSLLGWAPLIEASPVLEKFSLKMACHGPSRGPRFVRDGHPLKCLKKLELGGFLGEQIDLELATFLCKNATMLEEVVVGFRSLYARRANRKDLDDDGVEERVAELKKILPPGVKLTIN